MSGSKTALQALGALNVLHTRADKQRGERNITSEMGKRTHLNNK